MLRRDVTFPINSQRTNRKAKFDMWLIEKPLLRYLFFLFVDYNTFRFEATVIKKEIVVPKKIKHEILRVCLSHEKDDAINTTFEKLKIRKRHNILHFKQCQVRL
ncbi:hypothetical protein TSAR_010515 [Trichomalopsis sarcophagae]|uniref:Uncharacterized protein n=1 Tax=Trichomalopsis sarcophagae TaxID=543379 RepID=A0A232F6L9_9HYME|nr:hypothetical protein TSAR_010515 [Trichomalopsis sarcophagae]